MNKALVALLVVCAVAIAAIWWSSAADADPALPSLDGRTGAAAVPAPAASPSSGVLPANAQAAALPADGGRTEAPVDVKAPGTQGSAVRGRIVDSKGAPRAGVVLAMDTWAIADGLEVGGVALPPPGERSRPGQRETWTTRADGTFVIPLAKDRSGMLELRDTDLVFAGNMPMVDGKKGDQDLGDVVALRSARVRGVVQDEAGKPIAGVKVAMTAGAMALGELSASVSGADGAFTIGRLRGGKWSLRTASGKFLPTVQSLEIAPEEQREGVVLVVKPGNAVAGQVVDDRGVGVAAMKVGSKRKEARGAVDIERFTPDEATTTDANGYFTLAGLAEEAVSVRAFGKNHTTATAADVPVGTGNLVLRVERLGIVEGVLRGNDGAPIAGSEVTAETGLGLLGGLPSHGEGDLVLRDLGNTPRAITAADGTFRIESVRPGDVTVVATGATHRPARRTGVTVHAAQATKGVQLVADRGAVARIRVTDEAGKAIANAKVRAQRPGALGGGEGGGPTFRARAIRRGAGDDDAVIVGGDEAVGTATSDEQGLATLAALPAGELAFTATHAEFAPAKAITLTLPKTGAVDGAVLLRKPGVAEIHVRGSDGAPMGGAEVVVKASDAGTGQGQQRATADAAGVARVPVLAPGAYTAALTRQKGGARIGDAMVFVGDGADTIGSSSRPFTVAAGETTLVELQQPVLARVHGVVTGAGGPAAGCVVELVRDGDGDFEMPGFGGRQATAGGDGSFAFDGVEPGPYVLAYGKPEQVVKARHAFDIPANTADVRQDLSLRTGTLRVQVVAKGSGEGVEKAEVELVRADAPTTSGPPQRRPQRVMMVSMSMTNDNEAGGGETTMMTMGAQRARTDEDGVAVIEDVPVGDYTVRITHRKQAPFERKNVSIVEAQTCDLGRVELDAAGIIRGKVSTADGKAVPMAMVQSRAIDRDTWGEPTMAQGGSYRIQGLAAGKYKVRANAMMAPEAFGPEVEVEVKAGETVAADLQLPGN